MRTRFFALVIVFLNILCIFSLNTTAKDISLYINDKKIECDAPPTIRNDRTLVPVRAIMEAFGATVKWNELTKAVTVSLDGNNVVLTINSKKAKVGTTLTFLDCEPVIIEDRTFVPVRFIAETFNFKVNWDSENYAVLITEKPKPEIFDVPEQDSDNSNTDTKNDISGNVSEPEKYTNKITNIKTSFSSGTFSLKITAYDPISEYEIFPLSNPERIVLDLKDCRYSDANTISINKNGISSVRFGDQDYGIRIVTDIESPTTYNVTLSSDKKILTLYIDEIISDKNESSDKPTSNSPVVSNPDIDSDKEDDSSDISENPSENEETEPLEPEYITSVVIDAGHGGSDTGAIGYDENGEAVLYEKDVNLFVANEVVSILKSKGIEVYSTRSSDVYVPLAGRTTFANSKGATLFVSVHSNSFTNAEANGTLTIYSKAKDEKYPNKMPSEDIADIIQEDLYKVLETYDRGITSEDDLYVLRHSEMPAVLIELAFISNLDDRAILADDEAMSAAAKSIADSIEYIINNQQKEG